MAVLINMFNVLQSYRALSSLRDFSYNNTLHPSTHFAMLSQHFTIIQEQNPQHLQQRGTPTTP